MIENLFFLKRIGKTHQFSLSSIKQYWLSQTVFASNSTDLNFYTCAVHFFKQICVVMKKGSIIGMTAGGHSVFLVPYEIHFMFFKISIYFFPNSIFSVFIYWSSVFSILIYSNLVYANFTIRECYE